MDFDHTDIAGHEWQRRQEREMRAGGLDRVRRGRRVVDLPTVRSKSMTPYEIAWLACRLAELERQSAAAVGEALHKDAAAYIPEAVTLWRAAEAEVNHEIREGAA